MSAIINSRRLFLLMLTLCLAPALLAQVKVTGKVVDETEEPVIGASVMLKGGMAGTVTDLDGNFSIDVPEKSTLTVSCIGFITQEVPLGTRTKVNVVLKIDAEMLEEVVAVGYATVKKSDLTGSVSKVEMDDLNKAQVLSFDQALGGRVAGVQVVAGDGRPGAEANIVIRGSNTISENSDGTPLYVIDGFATEDANPASLNPNDIESIDVLKDASATAIYGARGANGVIIITTKRGSESAPKVTYDGYVTWQTKPKFLKLMDGYDFVAYQEELQGVQQLRNNYYRYDTALGRYRTLEDYRNFPQTDWQDKVFRAAPMTSHHLSLTGGTKNTKYSASVSYYNQQGTIVKSSYESIKARATLDQQIAKKLKAGLTFNFANNTSIGSAPSQGGGGATQYFLYQVLAYTPVAYADEDTMENDLVQNDPNYPYNPVKTIENIYSKILSRQINMNAYLSWNIARDLTFRATFAYNWRIDRSMTYNNADTYWGDPRYQAKHSNGNFYYKEWNGWSNEYTLTYRKKIAGHNITAMLGGSLNSKTVSMLGAGSSMVPWDELGFWGIGNGTPDSLTATNFRDNLASGFARFNYDWKSRYLLTATVRADGTSRFPYHAWGWFPSGSFAWRITEEPFMAGTRSWLSSLKLRAGWGATGNCNTYRQYPSQELYNSSQNYPIGGNIDNPAIYYAQMANRSMKWETTYQTNVGLDYSFLGNRISGEIDIYEKNTRDLLLDAEVPPSTGFSKVQQNIGSIRNRGLEFVVNTVNLKGGRGRLEWKSSFNISFNKSIVTALAGDQDFWVSGIQYPTIGNLYIARVGHPLSEMYGYVYDGVYQYSDFNEVSPGVFVLKDNVPNNTNDRSQIQPGDMKLKDINGDGQVTPEDQTVIGHGLPVHTGGFQNNFEYMGFDLSIFFQWSYGNDVINYNRAKLEDMTVRNANRLASAANHWTPRIDNGDGTYTDGNYTDYLCGVEGDIPGINTDRVVEDASFLRLKNVQLGYNFPAKLLRRMKISSMRIYVSGQNLWTWTRYTGFDPEVSTRNSSLTRGFDYSAYPRTTSYTFGVKVTF
ncbi:MAG: TonB-dependent receptor [Clostridium sp.]|nr:TonB-dependent receptor [Bacteroides sp.]MCM1197955.1 TonB-dependent receptor [Clostridium sp.]